MPGWHAATRDLREQGRLRTFGIVLEQHPDRAALLAQWKRLDWPVAVDAFNVLGVRAVPITLAVDEHGVVRMVGPRHEEQERFRMEFTDRSFPPPEKVRPPAPPAPPAVDELHAVASTRDDAQAWHELAVALTQWGHQDDLDDALDAARSGNERQDTAETRFALGVIYRRRYDSPARRDGDLAAAVEHWTGALERDPNNYIYRRRIQQYGPRLAKPYPFYDWIDRARQDIAARGESPVDLVAEPGGAELAGPAPDFHTSAAISEPDPDGRIARDEGLIDAEWAVIPSIVPPGESARVHVVFRPGPEAHWNNEADDTELWVSPPDDWEVDVRNPTVPNPPEEISSEARHVEFEVRAPAGAAAGTYRISAYSLYYICEEVDGTCLYRRRDLMIPIDVATDPRRGLGDSSLRT